MRLVTAEQLQVRVAPKEATPFFVDKLARLLDHIERQLRLPTITPTQRFILARDQAYFKAVFFSCDRPGDMGQVKVPEILRFPNDGLLFNHVWGKTLGDGSDNVLGIKRNPQTTICPVHGIERYMLVAQQLKLDLTQGYLFRPTTPQGAVIEAPFSFSWAEARLKVYLQQMVKKHCMASVRDVQSLWPSLGLNYRRLWIMWDGLVARQLFITYNWLFTTLENKARNLELRANSLGTRAMLIRWWMCPKRS